MDSYPLGDLSVHRVGFGAMQLPGPGVMGPPRDHEEAIAVLRRAVELGVNHIDTAQFYGPDVANELIREALHPYPDELVLVSKVGAFRDEHGGWLPGQQPAQLRSAVEDNLRSLGTDRLGAVNLRLMAGARAAGRGAGTAGRPAGRAGRAARGGQDRRRRHLDRQSRTRSNRRSTQAGIVCVQNAVQPAGSAGCATYCELCHELRRGVRAVLPTRLGLSAPAEGHRELRSSWRSLSGSGPRRPRSGWPGCWRTGTTCC